MMKSLDDGVGSIMNTLDDEQLANQTIVIFTNDNGRERFSNNGGLSNAKGTLWEGGIRVPAFVRWTGKINPGIITQQVAITMDWTATILSIGKGQSHPNFPLDGINLLPVLTGKKEEIQRTQYWRTFQRKMSKAIREGDWKYLQDENEEYLFNLSVDPGEKTNLKTEQEAIFKRRKEKFKKKKKTVLQPIPL